MFHMAWNGRTSNWRAGMLGHDEKNPTEEWVGRVKSKQAKKNADGEGRLKVGKKKEC